MHRMVMMGPPGVGKGTQSRILGSHLHVPAISTGELLRALPASSGSLAEKVRRVMAAGRYVDDELINGVATQRLLREDCSAGFVLDGYPRTLRQLDFLHRWLGERGLGIDTVVLLEADEETTAERMAARAARDHRPDDSRETFRVRLQAYAEQTRPLVTVYEEMGLLCRVDASGTVEEVARRVFDAVRGFAVERDARGGQQARRSQGIAILDPTPWQRSLTSRRRGAGMEDRIDPGDQVPETDLLEQQMPLDPLTEDDTDRYPDNSEMPTDTGGQVEAAGEADRLEQHAPVLDADDDYPHDSLQNAGQ